MHRCTMRGRKKKLVWKCFDFPIKTRVSLSGYWAYFVSPTNRLLLNKLDGNRVCCSDYQDSKKTERNSVGKPCTIRAASDTTSGNQRLAHTDRGSDRDHQSWLSLATRRLCRVVGILHPLPPGAPFTFPFRNGPNEETPPLPSARASPFFEWMRKEPTRRITKRKQWRWRLSSSIDLPEGSRLTDWLNIGAIDTGRQDFFFYYCTDDNRINVKQTQKYLFFAPSPIYYDWRSGRVFSRRWRRHRMLK